MAKKNAMDVALRIRRGEIKLSDVPKRSQPKVQQALNDRVGMRTYAEEQERGMRVERSRFHATGVSRARFT